MKKLLTVVVGEKTEREKAVEKATPEVRAAVKEYLAERKELRRSFGPKWMDYIPKEAMPYILRMQQLTTLVWIADHNPEVN